MDTAMQQVGANLTDVIRGFPQVSGTWFDLATQLMIDLTKHIESEELFISQYCEQNEIGSASNPNCDLLLRTQTYVARIVSSQHCLYESFEDACEHICEELEATHLAPFADAYKNNATLAWAVIKGIDLAYSWDDMTAKLTKRGPLNSIHRDKVGIYLKPLETPLHTCSKKSGFEPVLSRRRFNSQLGAFSFYWKQSQQELPVVVGIMEPIGGNLSRGLHFNSEIVMHAASDEELAAQPTKETAQGAPTSECIINIAVVSFTGINFVNEGENSPILLKAMYGTSFIVTYSHSYDDLFLDMISNAIRAAIANNCDVLVFPELTIAPSALGVIERTLRTLRERRRLKLVVAGSTYELNEDGSAGDNVCHIFDARGNEVGTQFKRIPFELSLGGNELVEALEHPGRNTTIVDVEGVGRVIIGICKDLAVNDDCVTRFVTDFDADLVILPAMSPSLDRGFAEATRSLATRHLAVSVVCNQCGVRKAAEYGRIVAPSKGDGTNKKQADCTKLGLYRDPSCLESCKAAYAKGNPLCCFRKVSIVSNTGEAGFSLAEQAIRI